jgi:hypothetical protein
LKLFFLSVTIIPVFCWVLNWMAGLQ